MTRSPVAGANSSVCGIFGVRGHADAPHIAQLGLYSLQHRGQESVGVVSIDDGRARARRAQHGHAVRRHRRRSWPSFPASRAVGHTRYSTAGSSTIENAQPVVARSKGGYITLAHNGNLINAGELRIELEEQGSIFASTNDSEVIVHRIARSQRRHAGRAARRRAARRRRRVQPDRRDGRHADGGARSARLAPARDGPARRRRRVRVRDVRARHRRRDDRARRRAGRDRRRRRDGNALDRTRCPKHELKRCVFEYVYFARPDSRVFGGSVDRARRALGRRLAREYPAPERRSRVQRARFVELRGARLRRGERHCRTSSRSFAITTSAARSFSRRRPGATPR